MNVLPASVAIAGFERLNTRRVNFDFSFPIRDEEYKLRSVVISEINTNAKPNSNLVIGSSALIVRLPEGDRATDEYVCYDPYGPIKSLGQAPITGIELSSTETVENNFTYLAQTRGNVFVYASSGNTDAEKILTL
jgi:hypothetical protein